MKKKELKNLAQRIAQAERTLNTSTDSAEIRNAQDEIMTLSNRVSSTDDMLALDEMVQKILSENSF